jgi:hypothetical protein
MSIASVEPGPEPVQATKHAEVAYLKLGFGIYDNQTG